MQPPPRVIEFRPNVPRVSNCVYASWSSKSLTFVVHVEQDGVTLQLFVLSNRKSPDDAHALDFDEDANAAGVVNFGSASVLRRSGHWNGTLTFSKSVTSWGSVPGSKVAPLREPKICFAIGVLDVSSKQLVARSEPFYLVSHAQKQSPKVNAFLHKNQRVAVQQPPQQPPQQVPVVVPPPLPAQQAQPPVFNAARMPVLPDPQQAQPPVFNTARMPILANPSTEALPTHTCEDLIEAKRSGTLSFCCSALDASTRDADAATTSDGFDDGMDMELDEPIVTGDLFFGDLEDVDFSGLHNLATKRSGGSGKQHVQLNIPLSKAVSAHLLVRIGGRWAVPGTLSDRLVVPEHAELGVCVVQSPNCLEAIAVQSVLDVRSRIPLITAPVQVKKRQKIINIGRADGEGSELSANVDADGDAHLGWIKLLDVTCSCGGATTRKSLVFWVMKHVPKEH